MKEIPIKVDGFEGRNFVAREKGGFGMARLYLDGKPVKVKFNKFTLVNNAGKEVQGKINPGFFIEHGNSIVVGDKIIQVRSSLQWYEYIWSAWTLSLIFMGGAGVRAAGTVLW